MPREDDALLLDMLIAARKIIRFIEGLTFESFSASEMAQSAVVREFQVIGEAARHVSRERQDIVDIEWASITGMRHRLVHEYFDIRLDVVWDTAHKDIPALIPQLEAVIPPNNVE